MSAPTTTTRYRVIAPYVTARSPGSAFTIGDRRPVQIFGYHRDVVLPPDVPAEDIERLLRKGMIAEVSQ